MNSFADYFTGELAPRLYQTFSAMQNIDTQFQPIAHVIRNVVEKELAFSTACLEFIMTMEGLVGCMAQVQNTNETDKNASYAYRAACEVKRGLETGASPDVVSARINTELGKTSDSVSDRKGDEDATQVLPQDDDSALRQKAVNKIGKAFEALEQTEDRATKFDRKVAEKLIEEYSHIVTSIEFYKTEHNFEMTGLFHAIFHAAMDEEDSKAWMTTIRDNLRHVVEKSKLWSVLKEKRAKCGFSADSDTEQMYHAESSDDE